MSRFKLETAQSPVPSAFGIFFTPWLLGSSLLFAAAVTMIAILAMLTMLYRHALTAKRLVLFAALYGIFAAGVALRLH